MSAQVTYEIDHISLLQQYQVHKIFVFYIFYRNLKEKDHIKRNINSKKKKCFCRKSVSKIRVGWALTTKN